MGNNPDVKLTTRRALTRIASLAGPQESVILTVGLENDQLSAACLPPSASAAVSTHQTALSIGELGKLVWLAVVTLTALTGLALR